MENLVNHAAEDVSSLLCWFNIQTPSRLYMYPTLTLSHPDHDSVVQHHHHAQVLVLNSNFALI